MRLFRGLKEEYRPERAEPGVLSRGVDFTDCPNTALQYASARRGVVLVLDVPTDTSGIQLREELWFHSRAKRFVVWGAFDRLIAGIVPAKDLRARLRQKGMGTLSDADKALVLDWFIRDVLTRRVLANGGLAGSAAR